MTSDLIYKFQKHLGFKHDNPFVVSPNPLNETVKAEEKKTTKEVNQAETAGYDYKDPKNLDNQIFDQYINGLRFEMEQNPELLADEPTEALLKAKDVVAKNLSKDPLYYMKNAAFGIEGLGYETSTEPKEPTGKHKSSGYGDLKENNMKKSTQLKELLEEAVAGIPSIGNPFAERKTSTYETKFASYLAEEADKEKAEEAQEPTPEAESPNKSVVKEKKMQPKEYIKEVEKLAKRAANEVAVKAYESKIDSLKETLNTINEDSNLAEFIDEKKTAKVQQEIALYEKYHAKHMQELEYSKNN